MAEESIAGGGLKQEMKRIKRKQRHLQSSQGLKKKQWKRYYLVGLDILGKISKFKENMMIGLNLNLIETVALKLRKLGDK